MKREVNKLMMVSHPPVNMPGMVWVKNLMKLPWKKPRTVFPGAPERAYEVREVNMPTTASHPFAENPRYGRG